MTYPEALDVARKLARADTKASRLLRDLCRKLDRQPTFLIMRYGDPRQWSGPPKEWDGRDVRPNHIRPFKRRFKRGAYIEHWRTVNTRPVRLQHIDSDTPVEYPSIVDFCAAHLSAKSDRFHVTPVLNGERTSFKGWYLPETLARKVQMRDVYGNLVSFKVGEAKRYGLTSRTICSMLSGKTRSVKGCRVVLADSPTTLQSPPIAKRPKIVSVTLTNGTRTITAPSLPKVARQAGIQTSIADVYAMAYGLRDEVRGFRIKAIKTEPRRVLPVP